MQGCWTARFWNPLHCLWLHMHFHLSCRLEAQWVTAAVHCFVKLLCWFELSMSFRKHDGTYYLVCCCYRKFNKNNSVRFHSFPLKNKELFRKVIDGNGKWGFCTYKTFQNLWWPLHLIELLSVILYALENICTVGFWFSSTFSEVGN